MKILVISDTHRRISNVMKLVDLIQPNRIVHLGDLAKDAMDLESIYEKIPMDYVVGNCDFYEHGIPKDKILDLMGKKIWLTHGHLYDVKYGYDRIIEQTIYKDVDVTLFGHTHIPYLEYEGDRIIMNPGSISEPREGNKPSFGILEFDRNGILHPTISFLKL